MSWKTGAGGFADSVGLLAGAAGGVAYLGSLDSSAEQSSSPGTIGHELEAVLREAIAVELAMVVMHRARRGGSGVESTDISMV